MSQLRKEIYTFLFSDKQLQSRACPRERESVWKSSVWCRLRTKLMSWQGLILALLQLPAFLSGRASIACDRD